MQVYLDFSTIFPIDIVRIIVGLIYNDFSFFQGRKHQLIIDCTTNMVKEKNKYGILDHIPTYIFDESNFFYIGRCVQFILDTKHLVKCKFDYTFQYETECSIISEAHKIMTNIQTPCKGRSMIHNLCKCEKFIVGSKYCNCGEVKCFLRGTYLKNLDDALIFCVGTKYSYKI
jgi:hypothetical protein